MTVTSINLSIIIPTLNEANIIEYTLRNLLNFQGIHEIIVADGGSSDGTLDIVNKFPHVKKVISVKGRGRQMNEGAKIAQGDVFLFLHADTCLLSGAYQQITEVMSDPSVVGGCFYLSFDLNKLLLKVYSFFSQINHVLFTYGDQGLFVRSHIFRSIGGFQEILLMEDVEIQKRLRSIGRFEKIREPVVTSARRYVRGGIIRQQILNTTLVFLYHLGVSPSFLNLFYYKAKNICNT